MMELASLKDWGDFIGHVGFPAFIAIVLLYVLIWMRRDDQRINKCIATELARLRELLEMFLKK